MAALMMLRRCANTIFRKTSRFDRFKTRVLYYCEDANNKNNEEKNQETPQSVIHQGSIKLPNANTNMSANTQQNVQFQENSADFDHKEREHVSRRLLEFIEKWSLSTAETIKEEKAQEVETDVKFPTLFRNSSFVQIGVHRNSVVRGVVRKIVGNDLYIDIGTKFYCVCPLPYNIQHKELYHVGTLVKVKVHHLEMASKFLDAEKAITLLEADASLMDLHSFERKRWKTGD